MTSRTVAGPRRTSPLSETERLAKIETLQRTVDEARLSLERLKAATKKAKEDLAELVFQLRRVSLNLPEDEAKDADGGPLFPPRVDQETGEVLD